MPPAPSMTGRLAVVSLLVGSIFALTIFLLWPSQQAVTDFRIGDIAVSAPWARATPGASKVGAAYLTIVNRGNMPDRLIAADASVAERVELHNTMTENGMMQMRPLESVALPPGQTVTLAPGGMHMMLVNLSEPLVQDRAFTLRLSFERAGTFAVTVRIAGIGATAPAEAGQGASHSGH